MKPAACFCIPFCVALLLLAPPPAHARDIDQEWQFALRAAFSSGPDYDFTLNATDTPAITISYGLARSIEGAVSYQASPYWRFEAALNITSAETEQPRFKTNTDQNIFLYNARAEERENLYQTLLNNTDQGNLSDDEAEIRARRDAEATELNAELSSRALGRNVALAALASVYYNFSPLSEVNWFVSFGVGANWTRLDDPDASLIATITPNPDTLPSNFSHAGRIYSHNINFADPDKLSFLTSVTIGAQFNILDDLILETGYQILYVQDLLDNQGEETIQRFRTGMVFNF